MCALALFGLSRRSLNLASCTFVIYLGLPCHLLPFIAIFGGIVVNKNVKLSLACEGDE